MFVMVNFTMKINIDLESITPIFISGINTRVVGNEGLRPPSLRGLMRWWFRVALGGAKMSSGTLDINSIKKEENIIWGTNEKRSSVSLRVSSIDFKSSSANLRGWGERYLGYGLSNRECIIPGSKFNVNIFSTPRTSEDIMNKVVGTIWLLLNLGNVGSKSRKGFGSLRILKESTISGISFENPSNVEDLERYIQTNTRKILRNFGWNSSTVSNSSLPQFPVLVPPFWRMKILKSLYSNPTEAINDIGIEIRKYREDQSPSAQRTRKTTRGKMIQYRVTKDYNTVKSIYTRNVSVSVLKGSIFGLPHQFQFQSIGKKAVVTGTENERRATPLHIKIWKLDGEYAMGLQLFKSDFLPENSLLISDLDNPSIRNMVNIPSFDYIEGFMDKLQGRWVNL